VQKGKVFGWWDVRFNRLASGNCAPDYYQL
jgi:hypothetical protein